MSTEQFEVLSRDGNVPRSALFSKKNPDLQTVWDASTISDLSECPRLYWLKHIRGFSPREQKVDLIFGSAVGHGLEVFVKEIVENACTHDEALTRALRVALEDTWDAEHGEPLLGAFMEQWRCTGTEKYKNEKGNPAKCPWSHKGKWFMAPGPETCSCGSPTETKLRWLSDVPQKDRLQVLRTIVWYTEQIRGGFLRPVSLQTEGDDRHQAMVEINWCIPFAEILGEQFWLTGNWDSVKQLANSHDEQPLLVHPTDYKTTKFPLTPEHFQSYWPGWQFEIYDMVAETVLPEGLRELYGGVMIEAMQVGTGWIKFGNRIFTGSPEQRQETLRAVQYQLTKAALFAEQGYWPPEKSACWHCPFKEVCGAEPHQRETLLREKFVRSFWNPLTRRREEAQDGDKADSDHLSDGQCAEGLPQHQGGGGSGDAVPSE